MFEHVLAANIRDEGHLWLSRRNVCEVLLRPHAQIDTSWFRCSYQVGHHGLKLPFIRHEFETKRATSLGKIRNHPPEHVVAQLGGKGVGCEERWRAEEHSAGQNNDNQPQAKNGAAIDDPHDRTSSGKKAILCQTMHASFADG